VRRGDAVVAPAAIGGVRHVRLQDQAGGGACSSGRKLERKNCPLVEIAPAEARDRLHVDRAPSHAQRRSATWSAGVLPVMRGGVAVVRPKSPAEGLERKARLP
jgi:hypothetical protein